MRMVPVSRRVLVTALLVVLVRILAESDPFGGDHAIVLETLDAIAQVGPLSDEQAVSVLGALLRKKKLLARRKVKAVRLKSLAALRAIRTPGAARVLDEAARTGDRMLRRLARLERTGG